MATVLYFFSGTGNSFKIAKDLAAKIPDSRVIPVSLGSPGDLTGDVTAVGVVFPVLMWGIPTYVDAFLEKMSQVLAPKYVFFVASNGGNVAGSFDQIAKRVKGNRGRASYFDFVVKRANFSKDDFDREIDRIAGIVSSGQIVPYVKKPLFDRFVRTGMLNPLGKIFWKPVFSASEKCTGCGSCHKMCPANNIGMVDGKPKWGKECNVCFGCVNWCPSKAVNAKLDPAYYYRSPLVKTVSELYIRQ